MSGEIHTAWREDIRSEVHASGLPVNILGPVTIHEDSDDCGAVILGAEQDKFWHDRKGAAINAIRNRVLLNETDILIVKFGEQYRQWNAAFDVGIATAKEKAIITLHEKSLDHALKEVDQAALATCRSIPEVIAILCYITEGKLSEPKEKAAE